MKFFLEKKKYKCHIRDFRTELDNLGLEYFATDVRKGELVRAIYGISLGIEPGTCLEETNLPEDTCEQIEKL